MAADPAGLFLWFPVFFLGIWLFVTAALSFLSGWPRLAERFRADGRPEGEVVRRQIVKIGLVSENGVTQMIASPQGLYIWAFPLFRFLRPPLMIPWTAVTGAREIRLLWWRLWELNVADITTILVKRKGLEAIRPFLGVDPSGATERS